MSKDWPWKKRSNEPEHIKRHNDIRRQRKTRNQDDKWNIELQIKDAIEDLEFKILCAFVRLFEVHDTNMEEIYEMSEHLLRSGKEIDISDTKPKPAGKIAERIFLKTQDIEFSTQYSVAKAAVYLRKADLAVKCSYRNKKWGRAFSWLLKATEEYGVFMSLQRYGRIRSFQTKKAAEKMLSNNPKQLAKQKVKELWKEWQKKPPRYKNQSVFARDMLDKFEILCSQSVVEGWCREWKKTSVI